MAEHSAEIEQMRLDYSTDQRVWDLLDEVERLRAEVRRFQRIIIDASEATADCEDLCGVLCAGPCQGIDPPAVSGSEVNDGT